MSVGPGAGSGFESVAVIVQRLAVLTGAGIPAASAWRHVGVLDDTPDSAHDLPERIAAHAARRPPAERSAWIALAAVWAVASEAGAALSPTLTRSADVLRSLGRSASEVETALAGPAATSRVVLALPAVAIGLGMLLGFDVIAALTSPVGLVCLVAGGILIVVAVRWNRRLLRWAREVDATPGLGFELLAVALSGGTSIERAVGLVSAACARVGSADLSDDASEVLEFARSAGAPVVVLLRAEADERRRVSSAAAARRAILLETRLLLPLGLCVLPAFVLLGVVPIALAILSSTALQT